MGKTQTYEHKLAETCCDYCGKKTQTPRFIKLEGAWLLFFFCNLKHQEAFGKREPDGYVTLQ